LNGRSRPRRKAGGSVRAFVGDRTGRSGGGGLGEEALRGQWPGVLVPALRLFLFDFQINLSDRFKALFLAWAGDYTFC